MPRISIVTSGHFCTSPRVWREADALSAAGYDVTVIGVSFDPWQAELDHQMLKKRSWTYQAAADLRRGSLSSSIKRSWCRFRSRLGRSLLAAANLNDPNALGYAADRVLTCSIDQNADLTITHLEVAMWVGTELLKRGFRVGVDIEDWYSESSANPSLARCQFLRALEEEILKRSVHVTTTSMAMADALEAAYGCARAKVIYNSVPSVRRMGCGLRDGPIRLIWFSQTLGKDRGLQDVFGALPLLQGDWTLEVRAHSSLEMRAWVESQVPSSFRSRVKIEPTVAPDELPSVVAEHDIGLALEQPSCRSKALTVSNKMFQYLQSGLLVAASDTPGQREVLNAFPQGGRLYSPGDPTSLAQTLNSWLLDPLQTRSRKDLVSREANERFGYERQAQGLLESVRRALEN